MNAVPRARQLDCADVSESYWADRFMFARRVTSSGVEEVVVRRDDERRDPPPRSTNKRRATIRVLTRVADVLLNHP